MAIELEDLELFGMYSVGHPEMKVAVHTGRGAFVGIRPDGKRVTGLHFEASTAGTVWPQALLQVVGQHEVEDVLLADFKARQEARGDDT